jgi:hypothetical protein
MKRGKEKNGGRMETGKNSKKSKQKQTKKRVKKTLFCFSVCSFFVFSLLAPFFFFSLVSLLFSLSLFWLRTGVWSRFPRQQRLNAGQSVLSQSGNATEKGKAANIIEYSILFRETKRFIMRRSDEKDDGIQHSALTACFFGERKNKKSTPRPHAHTHTPTHPHPGWGPCVCVCVRVGVGGCVFVEREKM